MKYLQTVLLMLSAFGAGAGMQKRLAEPPAPFFLPPERVPTVEHLSPPPGPLEVNRPGGFIPWKDFDQVHLLRSRSSHFLAAADGGCPISEAEVFRLAKLIGLPMYVKVAYVLDGGPCDGQVYYQVIGLPRPAQDDEILGLADREILSAVRQVKQSKFNKNEDGSPYEYVGFSTFEYEPYHFMKDDPKASHNTVVVLCRLKAPNNPPLPNR